MKKIKQSLSVLLICCLFLVIPHPSLAAGSHLQIVTTMFPIYDWIREITDGVEGVDRQKECVGRVFFDQIALFLGMAGLDGA